MLKQQKTVLLQGERKSGSSIRIKVGSVPTILKPACKLYCCYNRSPAHLQGTAATLHVPRRYGRIISHCQSYRTCVQITSSTIAPTMDITNPAG
jgi:hypothetical protein